MPIKNSKNIDNELSYCYLVSIKNSKNVERTQLKIDNELGYIMPIKTPYIYIKKKQINVKNDPHEYVYQWFTL